MHTPCPKCGRRLFQAGEVEFQGRVVPVFQCDECLATTEFLGEPTEIALTFALDPQGKPFDPASPDGSLPDFGQ